ncbi:MAG: DUF4349 domain-containing protein [Candidatus Doudnabacteria bacterium]|nr:DUF4349 domain-containing protein [Candidatus Doudnabacteria bacterium]
MESQSFHGEIESKVSRLAHIKHELDKLREGRKMLEKSNQIHKLPEVAAEIQKISTEIESLEVQEAELNK